MEPTLELLLESLERWLPATPDAVLEAVRGRDALLDRPVRWSGGEGRGAGIDAEGGCSSQPTTARSPWTRAKFTWAREPYLTTH